MESLKQFLKQKSPSASPEEPVESDWLHLADFTLRGGKFLIADTDFIPVEEEGVVIEAEPGEYRIQAKVICYGDDPRIARLRVVRAGADPVLGATLGETWTDTAGTGICDLETITPVFDGMDEDDALEKIREVAWEDPAGVIQLAPGADIPYAHSGFGDGTYPVFELLRRGQRAGFEVEFIEPGASYPFGEDSGDDDENDDQSDGEDQAASSALRMFGEMMEQFQSTVTGNKDADRANLKKALEEALGKMAGERSCATQEYRDHVLEVRQRPFDLRFDLEPEDASVWLDQPGVREISDVLIAAGFKQVGAWHIRAKPGLRATAFLGDGNTVFASITRMDGDLYLALQSSFADGRTFEITQTQDPRNPLPDWFTKIHRPDASPRGLIQEFQERCPKDDRIQFSPESYAGMAEEEARRYELWYLDRGGLTEDELRWRLPLPDDENEADDMVCSARQDQAELCLFKWLRHQKGLDFDPDSLIESLVIVHEQMPPDLLVNEWWCATDNFGPQDDDFAGTDALAAFASINEQNDAPLKRIFRKETGLRADYYLPADNSGNGEA